jgi:hypothetical protein
MMRLFNPNFFQNATTAAAAQQQQEQQQQAFSGSLGWGVFIFATEFVLCI